jgi:hypothetical protein
VHGAQQVVGRRVVLEQPGDLTEGLVGAPEHVEQAVAEGDEGLPGLEHQLVLGPALVGVDAQREVLPGEPLDTS